MTMDNKNMTIPASFTIRQALRALNTAAKKVLFVTEEERFKGTVSDGDIRRWILKNGDLDEAVENIMNRNPIFLSKPDAQAAVEIMKEKQIPAVPVVNGAGRIKKIYTMDGVLDLQEKQDMDVPVIVMAGGKGERLLPYTYILPKPLIPIGEKPIIQRVIESFLTYGCREFFITINYKKAMLKAYFEEIEKSYTLQYIEEEKPLGTGGSLAFLKGKINTTFFVSNCDILLDVDYEEVYKFHKEKGNCITVITALKQTTLPYGVVKLDEADGRVVGLSEKPSMDYLVNTGVYLIEPEVLEFLNENQFIHITDLIEQCLKCDRKVGTYPISDDSWMDMGQMEDLKKMKGILEV